METVTAPLDVGAAGRLANAGHGEFNAAVGEFIAYWLTQARTRTQHEWDHALVKALKGNRLRSTGQKAAPGKSQPKAENFAGIDYGNGGKL
ncbi:DnaT-like ssDNA-binding domain-containing protein [Ralstonia syzygii subsp. celebesensis]|uniref:DnaT-like ssDNA-binding domain-containing protein n=1 Tax=Ralstonia syzygii TaxID=28097 RepID=UPI00387E1014